MTSKKRQGKVRTSSESLSYLHWNISEWFSQMLIYVSPTFLLFLLLSNHKNHVLALTSSRLHRMNVMPLTETLCLTAWLCTKEGLYMPSIYIEVISLLKTVGILPVMSKVIGFQPNYFSNVIWHKSTKICGVTWCTSAKNQANKIHITQHSHVDV